MNDLIFRQAAIDRIQATGYADQIKDNLMLILRLIPPERKWIPCTESLPLISGEYLVTLVDDDGEWVSTAQWNTTFGGRWQDIFQDSGYCDIGNVIAWMTLPEPYKGDNHE